MTHKPPLWFIYSVTLTSILSNTIITPALPDILDHFNAPDSQAGILVAAGSIPGIVMAPVIGVLADRYGRKAVLVPCLFVFGIFGTLGALAPTLELMIAARLVQGLGTAGLINLAVVLIGDNWRGTERTKLVGRNSATLTVGLALLPLLSGAITEVLSWRWALGTYSIGVVMGFVGLSVLDEHRPESYLPLGAQLRGAAGVVRRPQVMAVMVSGLVVFMAIFGVFLTVVPLFLDDQFGLGAGWRGAVIAVPALTSTLVAFNLTRMQGRFGRERLMVLAPVLFVCAFTMIAAAPSLIVVVLGAAVYGLGEGVFIPALQDSAVSASSDSQRGVVMAVWVSAVRTGQSIGPLAAAPIAAAYGTAAAIYAGAAVMLVVLVIQIAARSSRESPASAPG